MHVADLHELGFVQTEVVVLGRTWEVFALWGPSGFSDLIWDGHSLWLYTPAQAVPVRESDSPWTVEEIVSLIQLLWPGKEIGPDVLSQFETESDD